MSQTGPIGRACPTSSFPEHVALSPASRIGLAGSSGRTQFGMGPPTYVGGPRNGSTPGRSDAPEKAHVVSVSLLFATLVMPTLQSWPALYAIVVSYERG